MTTNTKPSPADEDAEIRSILDREESKRRPSKALLSKQARLLQRLQRNASLAEPTDSSPPADDSKS